MTDSGVQALKDMAGELTGSAKSAAHKAEAVVEHRPS